MAEMAMQCTNIGNGEDEESSLYNILYFHFWQDGEGERVNGKQLIWGFLLLNQFIPAKYLYENFKSTIRFSSPFFGSDFNKLFEEKLLNNVLRSKEKFYNREMAENDIEISYDNDDEKLEQFCDSDGYIKVYAVLPYDYFPGDWYYWQLSRDSAESYWQSIEFVNGTPPSVIIKGEVKKDDIIAYFPYKDSGHIAVLNEDVRRIYL